MLLVLCGAVLLGITRGQSCIGSTCTSCAGQSNCGYCQDPSTTDSLAGTCRSSFASGNNCPSAASQAQYTQGSRCPSESACSQWNSCSSCSAQLACVWLAPGTPSATGGVCVTESAVRPPTTWKTYQDPAACSAGAAVAALSAGIITAIVLGVFFLIILPIAVGVAVCMGVAVCCCCASSSRPRRGQVATTIIMMPAGMQQVYAPMSPQQQHALQQQQQQHAYAMQMQMQQQQLQQQQQQQQQYAGQQQQAQTHYAAQQAYSAHASLGSMGPGSPVASPVSGYAIPSAHPPLPSQPSAYYPTPTKTL